MLPARVGAGGRLPAASVLGGRRCHRLIILQIIVGIGGCGRRRRGRRRARRRWRRWQQFRRVRVAVGGGRWRWGPVRAVGSAVARRGVVVAACIVCVCGRAVRVAVGGADGRRRDRRGRAVVPFASFAGVYAASAHGRGVALHRLSARVRIAALAVAVAVSAAAAAIAARAVVVARASAVAVAVALAVISAC